MAMKSQHKIERRKSRQIRVGRVAIGGDAPELCEPSVTARAERAPASASASRDGLAE